MIQHKIRYFLLLLGLSALVSCQTTEPADGRPEPEASTGPDPAVAEGVALTAGAEAVPAQAPVTRRAPDPFLRARILADMLYAAREAFDDNRLTFPAGDNAYDRYLEVLSVEPENRVALQGIADIVDRYVFMANEAIGIGQFDNAEEYLNRAASIDPDELGIAESRRSLEQERSFKRDYFDLDPNELEEQSLEIMSQLGSIGEYVKNQDATFLITARNDAEGRWIYSVMREAVGGYRLRGNITLGANPTIQVNIPQS